MFTKIDKTFPLLAADIAIKNGIKLLILGIRWYGLLSSTGTDPDSCLMYLRVKGEAERDLKLKKVKNIGIFKPGLLKNRKNPRCMEKMFSCFCCCCITAIEATECANSMKLVAESHCKKQSEGKIEVFSNSDMLEIAQDDRKL